MSALPLHPEPGHPGPVPASAGRPAVAPWPLLVERPAGSLLETVLGAAGRTGGLRALPGDLLIGLPLAVVGRAVGRIGRLQDWARTD